MQQKNNSKKSMKYLGVCSSSLQHFRGRKKKAHKQAFQINSLKLNTLLKLRTKWN